MDTAVKIDVLDKDDLTSVITTVTFEEREVQDTEVDPFQPSRIDRSQHNAPTQFVFGDPWHIINILLSVHADLTTGKMTTLRNNARAGHLFRVYPYAISDDTFYLDCLLPVNVPLSRAFAGQYIAGKNVQLTFFEASQDSEYLMTETIMS